MIADTATPSAHPASVRSLLVRLGEALLSDQHPSDDRLAMATARLTDALHEEGDEPPASIIHHLLGRSMRRDRPRDGLHHLLMAIELGAGDERQAAVVARAAEDVRALIIGGAVTPDRGDIDSLRKATTNVSADVASEVALCTGLLNLAIGRPAEALEDLRRALGGHVELEAHLALATAKAQLGTSARDDLVQALPLAHGEAETERNVLLRLAETDLAEGQPKLALGHLDALPVDPLAATGDADVAVLRASALLAVGDPARALAALAELEGTCPVEAVRLEVQVRLALRSAADDDAEPDSTITELATELLRRDPLGIDSIVVRAQSLIESGADVTEGRRLLRTVAGTLAGAADVPDVLRTSVLGRGVEDEHLAHLLAEVHAALAETSDEFARSRHLDQALQRLAPLLDARRAGGLPTRVPRGSLLRLNAELRRSDLETEALTALEVAAADALLDDGDFSGASTLLRTTVARPPANREALWMLTDAIRLDATVRAQAGEPVDDLVPLLAEGCAMWDAAFLQEPPAHEHAWAYAARSNLALQRSEWSRDFPLRDIWEAIAFQQVAVLLDASATRWIELSQLLRAADLDVCSLLAAERAHRHDVGPASVLEVALGRVNTGDLDGALVAILELRHSMPGDNVIPKSGIDELEAYAYRHRLADGDLDQASHLLEDLPDDELRPSARALRAEVRDLTGAGNSEPDWRRAADEAGGSPPVDGETCVCSLLHLGRASEAAAVAAAEIDGGRPASEWLGRWLGLAQLELGDADGIHTLVDWATGARTGYLLQRLLDYEFPRLRHVRTDPNIEAAKSQIAQLLERRRAQPPRPEDDLAVLDHRAAPDSAQPWRRLCAALTALGVALDVGTDATAAIATLEGLAGARIPAVASALADVAMTAARQMVRQQRLDALGEALRTDNGDPANVADAAAALAVEGGDDAVMAREIAAYAAFAADDQERAVELANESIDAGGSESSLGHTWAGLISRPRRLVEASRWLGARTDADHLAEQSLWSGVDRLLGLDVVGGGGPRIIGLDLGAGLLPADPFDPEWPLLVDWIPAMQQELTDRYGIVIPGVTVSVHPVAEEFVVRIDEGVVGRWAMTAQGGYLRVPPDQLAAAGVPPVEIEPVIDPLTGAPGAWLKRRDLPEGFVAPDPLHFVARRLGAALRQNLRRFVTVDQVQELTSAEAIELSDDELVALHELAAVLADDRIPLQPMTPIVDAMRAATGGGEPVLDSVRRAIADRLPGNQGERLVPLPDELERVLLSAGGAEPATVARILAAPGGLEIGPDEFAPSVVLLCRRPAVRRGLRRAVAANHPDLMVIADVELVASL